MTHHPDLIAGKGCFDSELIKRGHNQIISKGGSEGIQCIGLLGEGMGLSIKVEDGSKRAKHAVAIHLLRQLEWITPSAIEEDESPLHALLFLIHLQLLKLNPFLHSLYKNTVYLLLLPCLLHDHVMLV
jgi:hypothetical protein